MQRSLMFLVLHFVSKQFFVSEIFCFHKRDHEEGGRLRHRTSTVNLEVCQMTLFSTA